MLKLAQGFGFDLADTLASHVELLSNLLKCVIRVHADTKAHSKHALFTGGERGEDASCGFTQVGMDRAVDRCDGVFVFDEVTQ